MASAALLDGDVYKKAKRQYLKSTKNRTTNPNWTPFRAAEKRYKARFPPPDLSEVLDLALLDNSRSREIEQGVWHGAIRDTLEYVELISSVHCTGRKAFAIPRIPGLVVLPSFILPEQQKELIRWSLSEHARFPNETNLDTHYVLPEEGVWNRAHGEGGNNELFQPRAACTTPHAEKESKSPGPRQLINNTPASLETLSSISAIPKLPSAPSDTVRPALASDLVYKLRWANIGWHYHWGTKQYDFARGRGNIDERLRRTCKEAVSFVDWKQVFRQADLDWEDDDWATWNESYEPDAGIVNFYQVKDTLMAHVDRSEVCATSPLVSVSLGNAAVFLVGGTTRETKPIPLLLRSGDVVIMSGPECRRAYHGVPRILEGTLPPHLKADDPTWSPFLNYVQTTRININVRQVFPKGFDPETDLRKA